MTDHHKNQASIAAFTKTMREQASSFPYNYAALIHQAASLIEFGAGEIALEHEQQEAQRARMN